MGTINYVHFTVPERNLSDCRHCAGLMCEAQVAALSKAFPDAVASYDLQRNMSGGTTRWTILEDGMPADDAMERRCRDLTDPIAERWECAHGEVES
jgi:hypothetical protein